MRTMRLRLPKLLLPPLALLMAIYATTTTRLVRADGESPTAAAANERLMAACASPRGEDSVNEVKAALESGANINFRDDARFGGQTCLMAATLRGKAGIVRHLLSAGADPSIPEKDGYTPPHGAGFQGRPEIMRILREEGNLDVVNSDHPDGFAPLHRACWGREKRHADTVEYLLSIGEDVNRRGTGDRKQTCMDMTRNEDTIRVLKKYGAVSEKEEGGGGGGTEL